MNIVSKQDYWTTILNDLSQFGQISTEDPKFNEIAEYVWRVLQNTLILTEDEKQIKHWEEIVNVSGEGLTQFQRKVNLLFLLSEKSYIPMNLLRKALDRLLGEGKYDLVVDDENDKIYLGFAKYGYKNKAEFILSKITPEYFTLDINDENLPFDYIPLEFLETSGTQYINLPTYFDNTKGYYVRYEPTSWANSLGTVFHAHKDWTNYWFPPRVKSESYWEAMIFGKTYTGSYKFGHILEAWVNYNHNKSYKIITGTETREGKCEYKEMPQTNVTRLFDRNYIGRLMYFEVTNDKSTEMKLVPAIDTLGKPCMYDIVSSNALYSSSDSNLLISGLSMEQALKLSDLPHTTETQTLNISLPWEAQLVQHNAKVESALQAAKDNGWTIMVQYRDTEPDNTVYNKYATCVTYNDVLSINADYKTDMTIDGKWVYPLPSYNYIASGDFFKQTDFKEINFVTNRINAAHFASNCNNLKKISFCANYAEWMSNFGRDCPELEEVEISVPLTYRGANWFENCPKLREIRFKEEMNFIYTGGIYSFSRAILSKESVSNIFEYVKFNAPESIILGIHIDNQYDNELLAEIESAESKGLPLVVQWNGTPSTQVSETFGLRRQPIYAKLYTHELSDGTIEKILVWGHYVTNAEENGYQEFSSIEEANEYFNIESETEQ